MIDQTTTTAAFTVGTPDLKRAIGVLTGRPFPSRGLLPVLQHVRCDVDGGTVTLARTDLDLYVSVTLPASSTIDGVVLIPASDIKTSCPTGKGETTITATSDGQVSATFGPGRPSASMRSWPVDEWPIQPAAAPNEMAQVTIAPLVDVLAAVSTDMARPILTGVLLDGHRVAATDAYRLHVADRPTSEVELHGLVPGRALTMLAKVAKMAKVSIADVAVGDMSCTFVAGPWTITPRLIDGRFPAYENLIPEDLPYVIDLSAAGPAIDACRKAVGSTNYPLRLTVQPDGLLMTADVQDGPSVEATLPLGATTAPDGFKVGFQPGFLADLLDGTPGLLNVIAPLKAAMVVEGWRLRLLMPVRRI